MHCSGCGSSDMDWCEPQDGYSGCCNEPMCAGCDDCDDCCEGMSAASRVAVAS